MSNIKDPIVVEFIEESRNIIKDLNLVLEQAEAGSENARNLATYGQMTERILTRATALAMKMASKSAGRNNTIEKIADYAAVCKVVGYKTAQIKDNPGFYSTCVALLLDATEVMSEMFNLLEQDQEINAKAVISLTLIERLKWVSGKFSSDYREKISVKTPVKLNQNEIDTLLIKLGFA